MGLKKLISFFLLFSTFITGQTGPLTLLPGQEAYKPKVNWSFETRKLSDCEYELRMIAEVAPHWHIFSIKKSGDSQPTSFTFAPSPDYQLVGGVQEPKPHKVDDPLMGLSLTHEGRVAFRQKIRLLTDKEVSIKVTYEAQVCDSAQCEFPLPEDHSFKIKAIAVCREIAAIDNENKSDSIQATDIVQPQDTSNKGEKSFSSATNLIIEQEDESWWFIFLQGFIGGFAALLTPCVFPMIPMNVSFFTKQSKTKQQGIRNAFLYAVFLITLYVGLGLAITVIFGAGALHTLSTSVIFNLAFFVLLVVFAVSFLGAFEIVLPSRFINSIDRRSEKGGWIGIFFMAFTLALVSFSCTGPIIGTLLVQAAGSGSLTGPFWGMFGFSLALALPFGVFAAFPGWLNSLPKSGGWLNSVKVVLGFLELALALKFASNADLVVRANIITREVFITIWVVIFTLQGVYLLGGFKTAHDSDLKHVSVPRLFFAIASFFIAIYCLPGLWGAPLKLFSGILPEYSYSESPHGFGASQSGHSDALAGIDKKYTAHMEVNKNGIVHFKNEYEKALEYAKNTGKPLLIDFTGHACANCRKTEDYIWPDPAVTKRLNEDVVLVSLYVDDKRKLPENEHMEVFWYGKNRVIRDIGDKFKYMEETRYGQSSQPLYVMLDHNEKILVPPRGYNSSIEGYLQWLDAGITAFKAARK